MDLFASNHVKKIQNRQRQHIISNEEALRERLDDKDAIPDFFIQVEHLPFFFCMESEMYTRLFSNKYTKSGFYEL